MTCHRLLLSRVKLSMKETAKLAHGQSLWSESYRSQVDKKVLKGSMSAVRVVADVFPRFSTITVLLYRTDPLLLSRLVCDVLLVLSPSFIHFAPQLMHPSCLQWNSFFSYLTSFSSKALES